MKRAIWTGSTSVDLDLSLEPAQCYRALTPDVIQRGRALLTEVLTMIPPSARPLADAVRQRTGGRFHDEACALSGVLGVSWQDIILANVSYDLFLAALGCSTMALPTPDGPLIARNMDWAPEAALARASVLLRFNRGGKFAYANAGFPGSVGLVSGLSARGFGLVVNAVTSPEGADLAGYPVLLFLRTILEDAPDFESALRMLTTERLAMAAIVTLVGTTNEQRVVVERSPTRHALRWGEPGRPLMVTNHYRKLYAPEVSHYEADSTCYRYDRLCQLLNGYDSSRHPAADELLYMLTDPNVIQEITAQHVVMQPGKNAIQLYVPTRLL